MTIKPESLKGSTLIALAAIGAALFLNKYRPLSLAPKSLLNAFVIATFAVVIVQVQGRTKRPLRSVLFGVIGSTVLFRFLCWDPLFNNPGTYDVRVALSLWGGMTLIGLSGIVALEIVG